MAPVLGFTYTTEGTNKIITFGLGCPYQPCIHYLPVRGQVKFKPTWKGFPQCCELSKSARFGGSLGMRFTSGPRGVGAGGLVAGTVRHFAYQPPKPQQCLEGFPT